MNRVFTAVLAITAFFSSSCRSQSPIKEFAVNSNGLIYNDADMKHLRYVVDSLNLKFKTCDLYKKFYSLPQTTATYLYFKSSTNKLTSVLTDLKAGLKPEELRLKYKNLIDTSYMRLLIKSRDDKYILSGEPNNGYEEIYGDNLDSLDRNDMKGKWIYNYSTKDEWSKNYSIECYFIAGEYTSEAIPEKYAKLIQYVDCMIDTGTVISLVKQDYDSRRFGFDNSINDYLNKAMGIKKKDKDDWEFEYLSNKKIDWAIKNLKNDNEFRGLIEKTIDTCIENSCGSESFETLVANFISKEKALQMKRSRWVIGNCSMDQGPRIHALSIAMLAAETHSWDLFLRAHLDIMNDRFERRSDGSWAWGQRMTYLKELEELDLNIVDLMLGLTLRASNIADNHYLGTVWRLGRALAESKDKALFEKNALMMMMDPELDQFNRGLIYLLYNAYSRYLDPAEGKQKRDVLRKTVSSFPPEIQEAILHLEEPEQSQRNKRR